LSLSLGQRRLKSLPGLNPNFFAGISTSAVSKSTHQVSHVRLVPSYLLEIHLLLLEPPLEFITVSHVNQIDLCGIKQAF
jgi:hypothetical protein